MVSIGDFRASRHDFVLKANSLDITHLFEGEETRVVPVGGSKKRRDVRAIEREILDGRNQRGSPDMELP